MQDQRNQLLSWTKFLIGWPLAAVSIAFIVKFILDQHSQLHLSLRNINFFYVFLGIFTFLVYYLLRSYLWRILITQSGHKIGFRESTYRFAFSELKRYTPGNVWSFLSRASLFKDAGFDNKTVGIAILGDIQLVIIGCGLASFFAIPWILSLQSLNSSLLTLLPLSIVLICAYFVATAVIFKRRYEKGASLFSLILLPGFGINVKLKTAALATLTYFIYGLGNYFLLLSVFGATFPSATVLASFFTFSLLLGYLSFITPMGLGVRELIVVLGLSTIMVNADAATISIYTRVVLVLSEMSFLILIFLWEKL